MGWPPRIDGASLTGSGVVVGVVDVALDPYSPLLANGAVETWDQSAIHGGSAHASGVGRVFASHQEWLGRTTARTRWGDTDHGTEVAAIAAGRWPQGFAPAAKIVGAVVGTYERIPAAVQWIFDVAERLDAPCVVNISLRRDHLDPHDGSDLVSEELDSLLAPGRLAVAAAGNEGSLYLHSSVALRRGGVARIPFVCHGIRGRPVNLVGYARTERAFRSRLWGFARAQSEPTPITDWVTAGEEDDGLVDDWFCYISASDPRRRHAIGLELLPFSDQPEQRWFVELEALEDVTVDLWSADNFAEFLDVANPILNTPASGADRRFMIASPASAHSIVAVGASIGRRLCEFSNVGPTVDGRHKPEIALPGEDLVVGVSTELEGTSYAAPMLAGALACALEVVPDLDSAEARRLLQESADPIEVDERTDWILDSIDASRFSVALENLRMARSSG